MAKKKHSLFVPRGESPHRGRSFDPDSRARNVFGAQITQPRKPELPKRPQRQTSSKPARTIQIQFTAADKLSEHSDNVAPSAMQVAFGITGIVAADAKKIGGWCVE